MRDVELLLWTTSSGKRLRLGSGEWRTEEGGVSRLERKVLAASVYEWVNGWDGRGEP